MPPNTHLGSRPRPASEGPGYRPLPRACAELPAWPGLLVRLRPLPSLSWPLGAPLAQNALCTAVQWTYSDLRFCSPESKVNRLTLLRQRQCPHPAPCPAHPVPLGSGWGLFAPGSLLNTGSKRLCQAWALCPLPSCRLPAHLPPPPRMESLLDHTQPRAPHRREATQRPGSERGCRACQMGTRGKAEGPQHLALGEQAGSLLREETPLPKPGCRPEHRWPWSSHTWHPARNPLHGEQNRPLHKLHREFRAAGAAMCACSLRGCWTTGRAASACQTPRLQPLDASHIPQQ